MISSRSPIVLIISSLWFVFVLGACGGTAPEPPQPTAAPSAPTSAPTVAAQPTATRAASAAPTSAAAPVSTKGNPGAPGGGGMSGVETSGKYVADIGFRANVHGFSFENYGKSTYENLTADELRRMFGEQVCGSTADGKCILTPAAQQWMEAANKAMDGGHCEGLAALSLLFYLNRQNVAEFGGSKPNELKLDGNAKLQREIAYWFATQMTQPTQFAEIKTLTPGEVLSRLTEAFNAGTSGPESYTMGIYKPEYKAGHAITPYAVEDRGNGIFWVLVYDNNYPNIPRAIVIDRNADTWLYEASTNPSEPASAYKGDASTKTLTLTPTSQRLQAQACPFCMAATGMIDGRGLGLANASAVKFNQIWLDAPVDADNRVDLLLTDEQGRKLGYVSGKFVSEIPGASYMSVRSADMWRDDPAPVYLMPVGTKFTITVDGTRLKKEALTSVTFIGPGYDLAVDEIKLQPGQKDTITFSPDGGKITYKTENSESPTIVVGLETSGADYAFFIKGVDLIGGGQITVGLDLTKGQISLGTTGNRSAGQYGLLMNYIDEKGEQDFTHDEDITLEPNATAYLNFGKWSGARSSILLEIDNNSDGTIDDSVELTNQ